MTFVLPQCPFMRSHREMMQLAAYTKLINNDSTGVANGIHKEPGNKMEQDATRLAEQVVACLNKESQNKNQKDIQTLAEDIRCIQKD